MRKENDVTVTLVCFNLNTTFSKDIRKDQDLIRSTMKSLYPVRRNTLYRKQQKNFLALFGISDLRTGCWWKEHKSIERATLWFDRRAHVGNCSEESSADYIAVIAAVQQSGSECGGLS